MQGGPWGGGGMMQPRGGGFLQGALATAAGVAGGMMVANALTNAFSGDEAGAAGGAASAADLAGADSSDATGGITDGLYQDAAANPQTKATLPQICKSATDTARTAWKSYGCDF